MRLVMKTSDTDTAKEIHIPSPQISGKHEHIYVCMNACMHANDYR